MDFRILGPLEVGGERGALALGGAKPRALLAVLLLHPNQPVSPDRLALALWGEDAPAGATKTVQVHVSRLRKALGDPGIVETTPAGYRLRVRAGELDAERFARDVEAGQRALAAGRPEEAVALLRAALALWRGPPLADLEFEPFAQAEIARLEEQRLEALELRVEADLAAGRHVALAGELRQLAGEHPSRERLAAQLMLALYRGGRQAEALEAYRDARRALVEAAGVEPGPELQRLHEAVLDHDPALELAAAVLPAELDPAAAPPLVGREAELARLREEWERARAGAGRLVALCGPEGMGKTRLAAELAAEVHRAGAAVRYATANGSPAAVLAALDGVRQVAGPTLLVVDDAERAGGDVPEALAELGCALAGVPALVLVNGRDRADNGAITLGPLDAAAVGEIASRQGVPVGRLLEASGGVPRRAHEILGRWAREQAARRVDAAAGRTAAGRARLRSMEEELTGGVLQLQAVQERDEAVDEDAAVVCPFKGLASFDVADAPNFFGRERLVAELVARLVGAPLLGIVGASGSGKSSVLRAGLLPALANGVLPGSETWTQVLMRPGEHPLRELRRAAAGVKGPMLLAVDQFEETFTACRDEQERGAFVAELVGGPRTVVVAVRADFYGRCAAYPALSARLAAHHVLVGAMRRDELRRTIERPAERVGLRVEPELVDALIGDVEHEPGALPTLSTALLELWQRRDGRHLRLATYEATGGVRGAVARHAEDAFGRLDADQQAVARRLLLRLTTDDGAGGVERRRVPLEEIENAAAVLARLADERLLTVDAGAVELAHEALLREWPRLRGWLDADAEGRRLHRHLSDAAREWDARGRDPGELYRGARLAAALEWRAQHEPDLNPAERDFLAAAQHQQQAARARRRRALTVGVGLLVMITGISIILAVRGIQRARYEERAAASRNLAVQAVSNLGGDLRLAGLLGLEAFRREPTVEARSAILAVLPALGGHRKVGAPLAHDVGLGGVAISPDGRTLASAADDGTVWLWDMATRRRLGRPLAGHTGFVNDVTFSPDGTLLASASDDRTVRLWDVRARRPSGRPLEGHPEQVTSVDFSPDGTTLASAGSYGDGKGWRNHSVTVRLWDVASRRPLGRPLEPHAAEGVRVDVARVVNEAEFSPDGALLALAEAGGTVGVWDVATRRLARLLTGHAEWVLTVAFSPDGKTLASGSSDGTVRLWDARSGRPVGRPLESHSDEVSAVAFSPDGRTLASGGADQTVRLWSVATGRSRGVLRPDDDRPTRGAVGRSAGVQGLAFAPSGAILASAGEDGQVHLWDVRARGPLGRPLLGHDGWVRALAFTSGRTLASGGVDGTLRFWDAGAQRPVGRPLPHPGLVLGVAATADGRTVATAGDDGTVRLWDAESRTPLARPLAGHRGAAKAVAVSPDGQIIASGGRDATVRLWDADTHRPLGAPLPSRVGAVNGVALDADGATLAAAGLDGRVGLWDVESREWLGSLTGPVGFVNAVAFSPDGETVAGVGQDGSVWLWDLASRRPLGTPLAGHSDVLQSVAFAPDGATLASAGADGTVRLWDVATRQPLGAPLEGHTGWVSAVAFNSDGTRLASAGEDGTIRLWDPLLWSADRAALERRICGALQRNLTRAEWTEFLPDQPFRQTCPG